MFYNFVNFKEKDNKTISRMWMYQVVKMFVLRNILLMNEWSPAYQEIIISHTAETHLEHSQTSKMNAFAAMVSGIQPLIIFAKSFNLHFWLDSK